LINNESLKGTLDYNNRKSIPDITGKVRKQAMNASRIPMDSKPPLVCHRKMLNSMTAEACQQATLLFSQLENTNQPRGKCG